MMYNYVYIYIYIHYIYIYTYIYIYIYREREREREIAVAGGTFPGHLPLAAVEPPHDGHGVLDHRLDRRVEPAAVGFVLGLTSGELINQYGEGRCRRGPCRSRSDSKLAMMLKRKHVFATALRSNSEDPSCTDPFYIPAMIIIDAVYPMFLPLAARKSLFSCRLP